MQIENVLAFFGYEKRENEFGGLFYFDQGCHLRLKKHILLLYIVLINWHSMNIINMQAPAVQRRTSYYSTYKNVLQYQYIYINPKELLICMEEFSF